MPMAIRGGDEVSLMLLFGCLKSPPLAASALLGELDLDVFLGFGVLVVILWIGLEGIGASSMAGYPDICEPIGIVRIISP